MPQPNPPSSRADRARATRQHLIDTTIDVVRARSYGAATLFEVAKAAGVTPGALQHHFGSRAVLMMEVLQSILLAPPGDALPWPDAAVPLPQRATQFLAVLWARVYEPPRFLAAWSVYFGAAAEETLQPQIAEARAALAASLREAFGAVFPEAQGRADLPAFVDLVLASLRGIGVSRLFAVDAAAETAQRQQLAGVIVRWCADAAPNTPSTHQPKRAKP